MPSEPLRAFWNPESKEFGHPSLVEVHVLDTAGPDDGIEGVDLRLRPVSAGMGPYTFTAAIEDVLGVDGRRWTLEDNEVFASKPFGP